MRVAYVSHSLVHPRQALFAKKLRRQLHALGGALMEIYPERWNHHHREGGYPVTDPGNQVAYTYPPAMWDDLNKFAPDLLLVQQEPYCNTTTYFTNYSIYQDVPLVIFTWENANPVSSYSVRNLRNAAMIITGNADAQRFLETGGFQGPYRRLPQVGFDPDLFKPNPTIDKTHDIIFAGRPDPMKGQDVLTAAAHGESWRVRILHEEPYTPYDQLPLKYQSAKIQVTPSMDIAGLPREQFAPAVTIEGLLCGLPVVSTNQAAIWEWLHDGPFPSIVLTHQNSPEQTSAAIRKILELAQDERQLQMLAAQARSFAIQRFSNEVVAAKYVQIFKEVLA